MKKSAVIEPLSRLIERNLRQTYALLHDRSTAATLARHHAAVWDLMLSGEFAGALRAEFDSLAATMGVDPELVRQADAHVVWEATPALAALLACSEDDRPLGMRQVEQMLDHLLAHSVEAAKGAPNRRRAA